MKIPLKMVPFQGTFVHFRGGTPKIFGFLLCFFVPSSCVSVSLNQDRNHTGDIDIWEFVTWCAALRIEKWQVDFGTFGTKDFEG